MKKMLLLLSLAVIFLMSCSLALAQQKDTLIVDDLDAGVYYFEYSGPWENGDNWQGADLAGYGPTSRMVRVLGLPNQDQAAEWRIAAIRD